VNIVMLSNDEFRLKSFIKWMPDENFDDCHFYMVTDDNKFDFGDRLKKILKEQDRIKHWSIHTISNIITMYKHRYGLSEEAEKLIEKTKCVLIKPLLLGYFNKMPGLSKFMYIDDDVLFIKNIREMYNKYDNCITCMGRKCALPEKDSYILDDLNEIMGSSITLENLKQNGVNAGVVILTRSDDKLMDYAIKFIDGESVKKKLSGRTRSGVLDERFLSAFFLKINGSSFIWPKEIRLEDRRKPIADRLTARNFFHMNVDVNYKRLVDCYEYNEEKDSVVRIREDIVID